MKTHKIINTTQIVVQDVHNSSDKTTQMNKSVVIVTKSTTQCANVKKVGDVVTN